MHIKAYTGLSLCDLDHIPEERMAEAFAAVCADPHVLLAYHTISGRGLRVIYAFLFEDGQFRRGRRPCRSEDAPGLSGGLPTG